MTARVSDERGFTLVELLTAMIVGMIVLFALFSLVDTAMQEQAKAVDRIEANDHGRVGMDLISRQLTSRVCISGTQGSLVAASATQIEFYASLGLTPESATQSQRLVLERRRLTYRPAPINDVLEEVWVGTAAAPALPPAVTTTPTRTRTLLTKVSLVAATPYFFRYYALAGSPPQPTSQLPTTALPAASLANVARINISFVANGKVAGVNSELHNQVLDRSPRCYFG